MTIREIEALSGMDRANVRFYEREGLITPARGDNGYRDYSQNDLDILLRVKLLRSLHVSLGEIQALKDGGRDLADTLSQQLEKLGLEQRESAYAMEVCRALQADKATFASLDAKRYLDGIDRMVHETGGSYFSVQGDRLPQVFHPWRRYLARTFDISLYSVLWFIFLAAVFHVNILAQSQLSILLGSFMAIALMLVLEPLLLHLFGTTPGKAIFGLRVETNDGRRLSYGEGLSRTWGVVGAGLGYNIPIYSLVRLWKSYRRCSENEVQPWDEDISYTLRDEKGYRGVLYIGVWLALVAVTVTVAFAQWIPPHRGELTVAEFAENYNYFAKFLGADLGGAYLNENGQWAGETRTKR